MRLAGPPLRALALVGLVSPFVAAAVAGLPLCPTAALFDTPCPGCGLTRATLALLRGDVTAAFALHPLVFVLAPVFVGVLGVGATAFLRAGDASRPRQGVARRDPAWWGRAISIAAGALVVLVVAVWAARFFGAFGGPAPVVSYREWSGITR
jgi:hypothetical protein